MGTFLDQSASRIVSQYKDIIIIVFNRIFDELEYLKEALGKTGLIDETNIDEFQSEIYTPAVEELNIKMRSEFELLQVQFILSTKKVHKVYQ